MRRARTGDCAAFSRLAEAYYPRLLNIARRIVNDADEAQDVVQDALCNAFLHVAEYRHEAPFHAWLVRITRNEAVNVLRRRRAKPTVFLEDLPFTSRASASCAFARASQTPESLCLSAEIALILGHNIERLSPRYRVPLSLRELDELDNAEIARRLTLRVSAVKVRIHRARLTLRSLLRSQLDALLPNRYRRSLAPFANGEQAPPPNVRRGLDNRGYLRPIMAPATSAQGNRSI